MQMIAKIQDGTGLVGVQGEARWMPYLSEKCPVEVTGTWHEITEAEWEATVLDIRCDRSTGGEWQQ